MAYKKARVTLNEEQHQEVHGFFAQMAHWQRMTESTQRLVLQVLCEDGEVPQEASLLDINRAIDFVEGFQARSWEIIHRNLTARAREIVKPRSRR